MKLEFSSQRREILLFLTTNMAAVMSGANQQWTLSQFFLTFDMDQLGKIRPHQWKEHLKLKKIAKYESSMS